MVKCYICKKEFPNEKDMLIHVSSDHKDIIGDRTALQDYYHYKNRHRPNKDTLNICSCGREKAWVEEKGKYAYYCGHPDCRAKFRQNYENNVNDKYGVSDYLKLPEGQRAAMMGRSIAKTYVFKDGTESTVLSTIEYDVLQGLERLGYKGSEIDAPAKFNVPYKDIDGVLRNHIPDIYLKPLNLLISCKDGFDNPNTHPNFRKDRIKNLLQYQAILNTTKYNYIQIEGPEDLKRLDSYIKAVKGMNGRYVMPPKIDVYMLIGEAFDLLYLHDNKYYIGMGDGNQMIEVLNPSIVSEKAGIEFNLSKIMKENEIKLLDIASVHYQVRDMDISEYIIGEG